MIAIDKSVINKKVSSLPEKPGVYQFLNVDREIIYIGKARNLRKRVSSYFNKQYPYSNKVNVLVKKISDINYTIVDNESDALLLENILIKKHQPRYNVLLKDDKTFPWICIKNERFPRIFITRRRENDGSEYYGPYTSMTMVKTIMELIRKLYAIRTCSYNLSDANISKGIYKVCLEFHLKNCLGPCENLQGLEDYNNRISEIKLILKGKLSTVMDHLKILMNEKASSYLFEEAEVIKQKLFILKKYRSKSTIVNTAISNVEVFSIADDDKMACVNYFKIVDGGIVQSQNIEIKKKLNEEKEELLLYTIIDICQQRNSYPAEILVPFKLNTSIPKVTISIPKSGDKKKLLDLSERNAINYLNDRQKYNNGQDKLFKPKRFLEELKNDLRLSKIPGYIECFDNSNIQGVHPVASCIVFRDGKPSRKDYRRFIVKTVHGSNDYATMTEIIKRRYNRIINQSANFPDLIVIDGGKGQLNAALSALNSLGLSGNISIIAIAKRLEEIYVPHDPFPIYLNKNSLSLRLIQRIRNEAHRFGISFHKLRRSKEMLNSGLDKIDGIGSRSKEKLMEHFHNIDKVKNASLAELSEVVGEMRAKIIFEYFIH
jgi:excinuclease ABC subunit C